MRRVTDRPENPLKSLRKRTFPIALILSISFAIIAFKMPVYHQTTAFTDSEAFDEEVDWVGTEIILEKEIVKPEPIIRERTRAIFTEVSTTEFDFEDLFKDLDLFEPDMEEDLITVQQKEEVINEPEVVHEFAEVMPEFPGGEAQMVKYFVKNFKYPRIDVELGNEGTAYVSFVVGKDGKIRKIEFMRGVSRTIDKEIIRVLNSMPEWVPGSQRGKKVNVRYRWPIKVLLS